MCGNGLSWFKNTILPFEAVSLLHFRAGAIRVEFVDKGADVVCVFFGQSFGFIGYVLRILSGEADMEHDCGQIGAL